MAGSFEHLKDACLSKIDPDTVKQVIEALSREAQKLKDQGLSSWRFFLGVTNTIFVAYCFGAIPQHFWIVYLLEELLLCPARIYLFYIHKPDTQIFYVVDYCWLANLFIFSGLVFYWVYGYLGTDFLDQGLGSDSARKVLLCIFFGTATGPLLSAVLVLKNALIFHDVENTATVFIHLAPALLAFTLKHNSDKIRAAWPEVFHLDYFNEIRPWEDIFLLTAAAYWCWWIVYTCWLFAIGLRLPSKGYDTIFHWSMSRPNPITSILGWDQAEIDRRWKQNDYPIRAVLIYMAGHAVGSMLSMTLSVLCFSSEIFHMSACLIMTLCAVYNGAKHYTHYMLEIYLDWVRKDFGISDSK